MRYLEIDVDDVLAWSEQLDLCFHSDGFAGRVRFAPILLKNSE